MSKRGFLGIDAGTQGLSVVFTDENLEAIATGEGGYEMVSGLGEGCYEQNPEDWEAALTQAMAELHTKVSDMEVLSIGVSGQMHGEVLADDAGNSLGPARLWCDARNEEEGAELTERFGVKMPKRITSARWLWTIRNRAEIANRVKHITTPAGWLAYRLTGEWNLGIGDAAGMFPIDQATLDYDQELLQSFDERVAAESIASLKTLLPAVKKAGEEAGQLNEASAKTMGLQTGIPIAAAEGDQPAALAGSLIGSPGMVSCSFGTSVCANSVGDRPFKGVDQAVDHFCAVDGKPINMVWLRNGTTYMNTVVKMFGEVVSGDPFAAIMPKVIEAAPGCGGILALPFMDDEPGLGVSQGGTGLLIGLNEENNTPGNIVKAALLATMFNLKMGSEVLDSQGYPRTELVLTGGLAKTPELAQLLADVFETPVKLPASSEEGTAWGAALLAKYRYEVGSGLDENWSDFVVRFSNEKDLRFEPNSETAFRYREVYQRYRKLVSVNDALAEAVRS